MDELVGYCYRNSGAQILFHICAHRNGYWQPHPDTRRKLPELECASDVGVLSENPDKM